MVKPPLVSIIIVNLNGGKVFEDCLKSLRKIRYSNYELIIVDNGSTDNSQNTAQTIKLHLQKIEIIQNKNNMGFAGGNNQGYKKAKGNYVLLLNNDTKVTPDFLNILINYMQKDKELGVVQPKIKIMDKPNRLDNCGTFLTPIGFLEHWGYMQKDSKEFDVEKYIFSAKGACMLIRRKVIQKIGLFDNDFGSYFEESDFCWRAWLAGWKVKYIPNTYIYHKVGFTSKKMPQTQINYNHLKNMICSFYKNLSTKNLFFIFIPYSAVIIFLATYYFFKLQFAKSAMVSKAIFWNIKNIFKNKNKRDKTQRLRKQSDNEIFKYIMHPVNWTDKFSHFQKVEANFK